MPMIRTYLRVLAQLAPEKRLAVALMLANLALAIAQFAEPVLFGRVVDALSRAQAAPASLSFGVMTPLIVAWVGFGLFTIGAGVLVAFYADKLAHRRRLVVMARYFEHVLSLPLAFQLTTHSGRVLKVMFGGADAMSWLWLGFFREHLASLVSLLVLLPLTLVLNVPLGTLLLVLVLAFALLTALVVRHTQGLQHAVARYHSELASHASDALANLPVIQSFTRVEAELRELRDITRRLLDAQIPVLSWWAVAAVATRAASTLTVTAILFLGTWLFMHGRTSIGAIVTFMSVATMLISRLDATVGFIGSLFEESAKLAEMFQILDTTPGVAERPGARDAGVLRGRVSFEEVSFSYVPERPALDHVSFSVEPGETIALVGTTGSGKSTTLSLLYRAFDPQAGSIRADDHDVRDYTLTSLRRNVGVVFQEPMLFARSIRENLLVGKANASEDELMQVLTRAQALEVVERAGGLDAVLGERGRTLSGGERQRLSIARALLKDPPILILDEATAALDAETERKLKLALDEVMRGRTTFVIAHRLATVRDATRILVFERGRIIEAGAFGELVARGGSFAALARAQTLLDPSAATR